MWRIIDGIWFEGRESETFTLTVRELGNGHREASVRRKLEWVESGPVDLERDAEVIAKREKDPEELARLRRLQAARRCATRARHVCKALALDTLMTLTYRANQRDLALCKRHFTLFRQRMNMALGGWLYVAGFERQKRGAWHIHLACRRLPPTIQRYGVKVKSFNVARAIWRSVVGEHGGGLHVGKARKRSPARIASYLAKYISKDWEGWEEGARRLQTSPCTINAPTSIDCHGADFAEVIALAYAFAADGCCEVVTSRVSPIRESFFLATEPPQ